MLILKSVSIKNFQKTKTQKVDLDPVQSKTGIRIQVCLTHTSGSMSSGLVTLLIATVKEVILKPKFFEKKRKGEKGGRKEEKWSPRRPSWNEWHPISTPDVP